MFPLLAAAVLTFILDGGDLEQQRAVPAPPADCAQATAEVRESRRLIRNTAVTFGAAVAAAMADVASTAWADHRYACRATPSGQPCLVEWNTLTPTSLGLVAGKFGQAAAFTGLAYWLDRRGHEGWAKAVRWVAVAAGVLPAAWNVHQGLKVERARR